MPLAAGCWLLQLALLPPNPLHAHSSLLACFFPHPLQVRVCLPNALAPRAGPHSRCAAATRPAFGLPPHASPGAHAQRSPHHHSIHRSRRLPSSLPSPPAPPPARPTDDYAMLDETFLCEPFGLQTPGGMSREARALRALRALGRRGRPRTALHSTPPCGPQPALPQRMPPRLASRAAPSLAHPITARLCRRRSSDTRPPWAAPAPPPPPPTTTAPL